MQQQSQVRTPAKNWHVTVYLMKITVSLMQFGFAIALLRFNKNIHVQILGDHLEIAKYL